MTGTGHRGWPLLHRRGRESNPGMLPEPRHGNGPKAGRYESVPGHRCVHTCSVSNLHQMCVSHAWGREGASAVLNLCCKRVKNQIVFSLLFLNVFQHTMKA